MKDKLIALALKFTGAGWIWEKINGMKTKLGIAIAILGGGALMLSGATNVLTEFHACEAMACVVGIARGLGDNPNWLTMMNAAKDLGLALGIGGVAHKIVKAEAGANK